MEPTPANIEAPCPDPEQFAILGDWELIAGKLGDELIFCEAKRKALADAREGTLEILGRTE